MKTKRNLLIATMLMMLLVVVLAACGQAKQSTNEKGAGTIGAKPAPPTEVKSNAEVVPAADWKDQYPKEFESYMANSDESYDYAGAPQIHSYVEDYPQIQEIYKGIGFATDYDIPRGHTYAMEDVKNITRTKAGANCLSCKSPDYIIAEREMGNDLYVANFDETWEKFPNVLGCYDCHENEPGVIHVNRTNLVNAMEEYDIEVNESIRACAQCHNEYYFDPSTKAVKNPYKYGTDPESILKYYKELTAETGFYDFTNPDSETPMYKTQHPEFETFRDSLHAKQGLTCPDCHMSDEGDYTSHQWTSPFRNETIMKDKCLSCHQGSTVEELETRVNTLQDMTQGRVRTVADQLVAVNAAIAAKKDTMPAEDLEKAREYYRDAQWYWDFVFVENGDGFHNSELADDCLDKSEELIVQANEVLQ